MIAKGTIFVKILLKKAKRVDFFNDKKNQTSPSNSFYFSHK